MHLSTPESSAVHDWLLEAEQPSVRYLTLTRLLCRPEGDPEVRSARAAITERGWAAEILARQDPAGWWASGDRLYRPKYLSTNWMLLILSDLGVTREEPRVATACELWMERLGKPDGGFAPDGSRAGHLCTTGNMARALVRFGYADHPRVRLAFEWLASHRHPKGGWSCSGRGRDLDAWEALSAFSVYPRSRWTGAMAEAVALGAELFLDRELHRQGQRYEPWFRFHYPVHYYYDLLVGLDVMTALGCGRDPRLEVALDLLLQKRRLDGRWDLDAVHPDVEGGVATWMARYPTQAPKPFALERAGEPSKVVTLTALTVLHRLEAPA